MACPATEPSVVDQVVYASLSIVTFVILGPLVFWLIPKFILFIIREIRLDRAVHKALDTLGNDRLLELLNTISTLGNKEPLGCLLHEVSRKNETGVYTVRLPKGIPNFPWSGLIVKAECTDLRAEDPVAFSLITDGSGERLLEPSIFWPPRIGQPGKKAKHVYSPARLLKLSPEVKRIADEALPGQPERFLGGVFRRFGLLENSVRIGLHPEWVQQWRPHTCSECSKPMRLIIQIPGYEIHKDLGDFVFYYFGCERHPHITQSAWDVS